MIDCQYGASPGCPNVLPYSHIRPDGSEEMTTAIPASDFETLYGEYHDRIFRAAFRLTGNMEDAEDVMQETYLRAFSSFSGFEGRSSFGTWLYRIMVNCSYRYMKKRDRLPVQMITADRGITETDFWDAMKSHESAEDIAVVEGIREACLQLFLICMPRKQRIAFTLKILMGLPSAEVARIMDSTVGSVKVNVHRAKRHLLNNMDGRCSLIDPKSPCRCANWYGYLRENGKLDATLSAVPVSKPGITDADQMRGEIDFLRNVKTLYSTQTRHECAGDFVTRMKTLIDSSSLAVFK